MAAVLVPLAIGRGLIPASQKPAIRKDLATQHHPTPALRSTAARVQQLLSSPKMDESGCREGVPQRILKRKSALRCSERALSRDMRGERVEHGDAEIGVAPKSSLKR